MNEVDGAYIRHRELAHLRELQFQKVMRGFCFTIGGLSVLIALSLVAMAWYSQALLMASLGFGCVLLVRSLLRRGFAVDGTGQPLSGDDADKAAQFRMHSARRSTN